MVVLNGWYLYRNEGAVNPNPRLCKVIKDVGSFESCMVLWADIEAIGFAGKEHLTPLPLELTPILSDSIKTGETND